MIIGIDPGKHGAIAVLSYGEIMQIVSLEDKDATKLSNIFLPLSRIFPAHVFIEDVHASPQMGVVSAFTFGKNYGILCTVAEMYWDKINYVRPATWQAALGCMSGGDKTKLFHHAMKLHPKEYVAGLFKKDQADAVLIAHYGAKVIEYANH